MKWCILLVVLATVLGCNMVQNTLPLVDQQPKLLLEVPNGKKYLVGDAVKNGNYLYIANIKGTPYEMGVAYGKLFAPETEENLKLFYNYYLSQLEQIL